MDFEIELFSKAIKEARLNVGLSQNDVFNIVGINTETLRKIESGRVIPKFETLELLSKAYKMDVSEIFLKYRIKEYDKYSDIRKIIQSKLSRGQYDSLSEQIIILDNLLETTENSLYRGLILQLELICKAMISFFIDNDIKKSNLLLVKAIEITSSSFDLENVQDGYYSELELQIIMYLTFSLAYNKNYSKQIEILKYCISKNKNDLSLKQKLYTNLSLAYLRNSQFMESINTCEIAIFNSEKYSNFEALPTLYFNKGCAEFRMQNDEYNKSFKRAIILSKLLGQYRLHEKIKRKIFNIYKIDYSNLDY